MATLQPVAAGFMVIPAKDRERDYVRFLLDRGDTAVPLEEALFDLRHQGADVHVMLLPFRSYEAAKRLCKAFERACRDHQKAARQRGGIATVEP